MKNCIQFIHEINYIQFAYTDNSHQNILFCLSNTGWLTLSMRVFSNDECR